MTPTGGLFLLLFGFGCGFVMSAALLCPGPEQRGAFRGKQPPPGHGWKPNYPRPVGASAENQGQPARQAAHLPT